MEYPQAKLVFNLDNADQEARFNRAVKADKYSIFVDDFQGFLRSIYKYDTYQHKGKSKQLTKSQAELIDYIYSEWFNFKDSAELPED